MGEKKRWKIKRKAKPHTNRPPGSVEREDGIIYIHMYIIVKLIGSKRISRKKLTNQRQKKGKGIKRKKKKTEEREKNTSAITRTSKDNEYFMFLLYTNVRHRRCFSKKKKKKDDSHTRNSHHRKHPSTFATPFFVPGSQSSSRSDDTV